MPVPRPIHAVHKAATHEPRFHVGVCGLVICLFLLARVASGEANTVEFLTMYACGADAWDAAICLMEFL